MQTFLHQSLALVLFSLFINLHAQVVPEMPDPEKFLQSQERGFEENRGQVLGDEASRVKYRYVDGDLSMFLLPTGIAYQFHRIHYPEGFRHLGKLAKQEELEEMDALSHKIRTETYRMDVELVGANSEAIISTDGKSAAYFQYYSHDAFDVHRYSKVTYTDIYPHIDWVFSQEANGDIKYDFVVRPGGDPAQIRFKTRWVEDFQINEDGGITLGNRMGSIREKAPISFQGNLPISTRFCKKGEYLGFELGTFDPSKDLRIDPTLAWAKYVGGADYDRSYFCKVDGAGNVYTGGETSSPNFLAWGGFQISTGGNSDGFLSKFSSNGFLLWSTYYGGSGNDAVYDGALDALNNVYLVGITQSATGISFNGHQNAYGYGADAFAVKFDANGVRQWATYYGGGSSEVGRGCATDGANNFYMTGNGGDPSVIPLNGHQNMPGGSGDAFLVKFSSTGIRLWGTFYGGWGQEDGVACIADAAGNIFLAGNTSSTNAISTGSHQNNLAGLGDAFIVKFSSGGVRQWGTYYGGSGNDYGLGLSIDPSGSSYLSGYTNSTSGIAASGFQNANGGGGDAYLVKFDGNGVRQWGTYYGGAGDDECTGNAVNNAGNIFLTGWTTSTANLAFGGFQNSYGGGQDAFIAEFTSGGLLQWGSYLGTYGQDEAMGCATSGTNRVYVAGQTNTFIGIAQNSYGGGFSDGFLTAINYTPCLATSSSFTQSTCGNYTFNGVTYTSSGIFNQHRSNALGCDSILTLNLTIRQASAKTLNAIGCGSYNLNSQTYTSSGTYIQTLTNAVGCDSVLTLHLGIGNPTYSTLTQTVCNSITVNSQTYTTSGTYTQMLTNAVGCDSTLTLNLTVHQASIGALTQTACNSIIVNNQTYTSSGTYTQHLTNAMGCDSTLTLNLTVLQPTTGALTQTGCNGITVNSQTYTSSGTYTQHLTNAMGCDSTLTLNLTVQQPTTGALTQTACDSVGVNGQTYTSSGTYTQLMTNAAGCDSTLTLNLTIGQATTAALAQTACGSITVNNQSYTASGTYSQTLSNVWGCDSTLTLNLLIRQPSFGALSLAACDHVTVNNQTYVSSGTYTQSLLNVWGCDSTLTINVSLYPSPPFAGLGPDSTYCTATQVLNPGNGFTQYLWQNGSTQPTLSVSSPGIYAVTVTDPFGCTAIDSANINLVTLSLGADINLCAGQSTSLQPSNSWASYAWSNGATTPAITVANPGMYVLSATHAGGCVARDTINVSLYPSPPFAGLGPDSTYCTATQVLNPGNGFTQYQWQNGSTQPTLSVNSPGVYTVTVTDAFGCTKSDTVNLGLASLSLGADQNICRGQSTTLQPGSSWTSYAWSNGATTPAITVANPGMYVLSATHAGGCVARDTVNVSLYPSPPFAGLGPDTSFCDQGTLVLQSPIGFADYVWNTGAQQSALSINAAGLYWVRATDSFGCIFGDSILVSTRPLPMVSIASSNGSFTLCNGDTALTLVANPAVGNLIWSTGGTGSQVSVGASGTYWVELVDSMGCAGRDTVVVMRYNQPNPTVNIVPSGTAILCLGDSLLLMAGGGYASYAWNTGAIGSWIRVTQPGTYNVTVTNLIGCLGHAVPVTVIQDTSVVPQISLILDTLWCSPALSYQWRRNSLNIPGAINAYHVPVLAGVYDVLVDNLLHCPMNSDTLTWSPSVGIDVASLDTWTLYPNPSHGEFFLEFGTPTPNLQVRIFDALGKLVYENALGNAGASTHYAVHPGELSAGVYHVWFEYGDAQVGQARLILCR